MSTQYFNQDDVLGVGDIDDTDTLNATFDDAAAGQASSPKPKSKGFLGLSVGMWLMMAGVTVFVLFFVSRMFMGRSGHAQADTMADASMSLENTASEAPTRTPQPVVQDSPTILAPAEPVTAAVPHPDAADLATPSPVVPAEPVAALQSDPIATASRASQAPTTTETIPAAAAPAATAAASTTAATAVSTPTESTTPVASTISPSEVAQLRQQVTKLEAQVATLIAGQPPQKQQRPSASAPSPAAKPRRVAPRSTATRPPRATAVAQQEKSAELRPVSGVSLRAVVGESAWIQTTSGESIQIQKGDVIPGVGTVKGVNAETAQVQLDDGRVLR